MVKLNDKFVKEGPFYYDDGRFCLYLTRWGTYASVDREGNKLVSGINKEAVEFFSREKLDGYPNCWTSDTGVKFTGKDSL